MSCQTCPLGNKVDCRFGIEFLPNATMQWSNSTDDTSILGKNTIKMILSVGNIQATFLGPPQDVTGDSYLALKSYPKSLSVCRELCQIDLDGKLVKKYVCDQSCNSLRYYPANTCQLANDCGLPSGQLANDCGLPSGCDETDHETDADTETIIDPDEWPYSNPCGNPCYSNCEYPYLNPNDPYGGMGCPPTGTVGPPQGTVCPPQGTVCPPAGTMYPPEYPPMCPPECPPMCPLECPPMCPLECPPECPLECPPMYPPVCPPAGTVCPPAGTVCPPAGTVCPPAGTVCPQGTVCPPAGTVCPQGTVCPPAGTVCPPQGTVCPPQGNGVMICQQPSCYYQCYPRNLVDPVYAYLEANPNNVMYPTAQVPYHQSIHNPLLYQNAYLKQYNACRPCNPCCPSDITMTIDFPNIFFGEAENAEGETLQNVRLFNVLTGTTTIKLTRDSRSSSTRFNATAALEIGNIIKLFVADVEINYVFQIKNGLPTWFIYGGRIDFRNDALLPLSS